MREDTGVYAVVNVISGKVYVGSTMRSFERRRREHMSALRRGNHDNSHLQRAWGKYGPDAFEFVICEYIDVPNVLIEREQYWLDWHRLHTEVYNVGMVAHSPRLGCIVSESTRRKLSEINRGKRHSEATRRKISKAGKGKIFSEAARRKIGDANARRIVSDETRQKMRCARSKPFPAFIHRETGEVIRAGINLKAMCCQQGLDQRAMWRVMHGVCSHHLGWMLACD